MGSRRSNAVDLIADNEWFRWYDPRGKNLGVKRRGSIPFAGLCRDCGTTALSAEFGGFLARACTKPLDYLRLPFLAPAWGKHTLNRNIMRQRPTEAPWHLSPYGQDRCAAPPNLKPTR